MKNLPIKWIVLSVVIILGLVLAFSFSNTPSVSEEVVSEEIGEVIEIVEEESYASRAFDQLNVGMSAEEFDSWELDGIPVSPTTNTKVKLTTTGATEFVMVYFSATTYNRVGGKYIPNPDAEIIRIELFDISQGKLKDK